MIITAQAVKNLRDQTGAPMMDCKKALEETQGDIEAAIKLMREQGKLKATKKSGRIAAEGRIVIAVAKDHKKAIIVEMNCETDFVAKDSSFVAFSEAVAQLALKEGTVNIEALKSLSLENGQAIEDRRQELVGKIGENIQLRRAEFLASAGYVGSYLHGSRIGVLVSLDKADEGLAKDIAMHIAASRPLAVNESQVSPDILASERDIYRKQAQETGKPADIIEKMVEGRVQKFIKEQCLVGQVFVKNSDQIVGALLKERGVNVLGFVRFEVGEGIEKEKGDFAKEVMEQMKGRI